MAAFAPFLMLMLAGHAPDAAGPCLRDRAALLALDRKAFDQDLEGAGGPSRTGPAATARPPT